MKTFSTYESPVVTRHTPHPDQEPADLTPEEQAWYADQDEAIAASAHPRTVRLPGREPLDLESISDLWLD